MSAVFVIWLVVAVLFLLYSLVFWDEAVLREKRRFVARMVLTFWAWPLWFAVGIIVLFRKVLEDAK